jgi:hypothetical protein
LAQEVRVVQQSLDQTVVILLTEWSWLAEVAVVEAVELRQQLKWAVLAEGRVVVYPTVALERFLILERQRHLK